MLISASSGTMRVRRSSWYSSLRARSSFMMICRTRASEASTDLRWAIFLMVSAYSWMSFSRSSCVRRSEEHTSELQSLAYLVCRLLLEKKKKYNLLLRVEINTERPDTEVGVLQPVSRVNCVLKTAEVD